MSLGFSSKVRKNQLRIYPDEKQKQFFEKNFGCRRKVYNTLLGQFEGLLRSKADVSTYELIKAVKPLKDEFVYLKEADSTSLQNAARDLHQAYTNHLSTPSHFGFPKFKAKKKARKSYRSNAVNGNIRIDTEKKTIRLPKAGEVRYKGDSRIPVNSRILSATISEDRDGRFYVSLTLETICENQAETPKATKQNTLALDFSMPNFYIASDGTNGGESKFIEKQTKKLRRAQKKLSRSKKGSKGREKCRLVVAKIHRKANNRRDDRNHKASRKLADSYDYVVVEDLNIKGMEKFSKGFARQLADHAWFDFLRMLEYKLEDKGGKLIRVDRFFPSSQLCSVCGAKNTALKDLKIREWVCPECGAELNRDLNACANLLAEGIRIQNAQTA